MPEKIFHKWENAKAFWNQLVEASARNIEMITGDKVWTVKGDFSCLDVTDAEMNRIDEAIEKIWALGNVRPEKKTSAFWVGNNNTGPGTGTWKTPDPSQKPTPWRITDGIAGSRDDNKKTRLKDAREMLNRGRL